MSPIFLALLFDKKVTANRSLSGRAAYSRESNIENVGVFFCNSEFTLLAAAATASSSPGCLFPPLTDRIMFSA